MNHELNKYLSKDVEKKVWEFKVFEKGYIFVIDVVNYNFVIKSIIIY